MVSYTYGYMKIVIGFFVLIRSAGPHTLLFGGGDANSQQSGEYT